MFIFFSTHHKTGTVFWNDLTNVISKRYNIRKVKYTDTLNLDDLKQSSTDNKPILILDDQSKILEADLSNHEYIGIHSIRNPANIIYSATNYHIKGSEGWLHDKTDNGLTYFESLQSFSNFSDKLDFELKNSSKYNIDRMYQAMNLNNLYHVDIDDISSDVTMHNLINIFYFLKIQIYLQITLDEWIDLTKKFCLWNIGSNIDNWIAKESSKHLTTKKPGIYLDNTIRFTSELKETFKDVYGNDIYNDTFVTKKFISFIT